MWAGNFLPLVVRPSVRQSVRQVTLYHAHDPKLFVLHATTTQPSTTPVALPPRLARHRASPLSRRRGRCCCCVVTTTTRRKNEKRRGCLCAAARSLTAWRCALPPAFKPGDVASPPPVGSWRSAWNYCAAATALLLPLPLEDEEETMHDYSCAMLINQCSLLLWLFTELIFTALYLYDGAARPGQCSGHTVVIR